MTTNADGMQVLHRSDELISKSAADVMADALGRVAALNHIPITKTRWWHMLSMSAWRHGTIAWRQNYLRSLPGQPTYGLAIDTQIIWIKLAGTGALVLLVVLHWSGVA